MRSALVITAVLAVALLPRSLDAQTLEDCSMMAHDRDRLSCYDSVLGRSTPAERTSAGAGDWEVRQEPSPFTDDTNVYLSVQSIEAVDCGWNRDEKVVLWIRCREDTTTVLFETSCHMTSSDFHNFGDVTYRFDDGPSQVISMTKSRNNRSLGLWRGSDSIPFIREMFGAEIMYARMTPFDAGTFTASFDIAGLEVAIVPLREACHW